MTSVDVIIPCHQYGRFLADCVASVLAQDVAVRVLIIDDASDDETPEVVSRLARSDPRVQFRRHGTNAGHIATYNEGVAWAEAEFVTVLSADDLLMPGALARSSDALRATPAAFMAYGNAIYFEDGIPAEAFASRSVSVIPWPHNADDALASSAAAARAAAAADGDGGVDVLPGRVFYRMNRFINRPHMSSVVMRRAPLAETGGFRPDLPHAGDFELWLRLAALGPVTRVRAFHVAARMHGSNMSARWCSRIRHDIEQRALALDVLEETCSRLLDPGLMRMMRAGLARSAVRAAGLPLMGGDLDEADKVLAIARTLDPRVVRSPTWALVALKRRLGPRLWGRIVASLRPLWSATRSR